MNRRGFLTCLAGAIAAPAVVRSGIIMPVRAMPAVSPPFAFSEELIYEGPQVAFNRFMSQQIARGIIALQPIRFT